MNLPERFLHELALLGSGGGWVFWVLVLLAFGIAYSLIGLWNALHFPDAILLSPKEWTRFLGKPTLAEAPMQRLTEILVHSPDPGRQLQEIGKHLFSRVSRRFPFAFVMIGSAPLLGLLGTVTGMFATFAAIAGNDSGRSPMDAIAGGIFEALITTLTGLVIGVPTYIVCAWLKSRHDDMLVRYQRAESELLQRVARERRLHA
jgi:biopolymer transport protein ExbB